MTEDPLINQRLDEYLIESLLGKGGMARVYRGVDVNLKRYVAVKVIDTPYQSDSDYMMRFEREAQVIAQLSHPNVVQLYRYGKEENFLYMVMQYIQGADLHTILSGYREDDEFMEPDEVRQVIGDMCQALDYIHSQGVIHRDVKPSNILLTREGRAILSDFGLALLTEIGTLGRIFGSPQYIAPEQAISSARAEPRSDLYSVGVILYEIFTGMLPFAAEDPLELAMQHVSNTPPPPRQLRSEVGPEVEAVILKALAKEPDQRYPSGTALFEALDQAMTRQAARVAAIPSTLTHLTIPERVKLETESKPLPSIPGAEEESAEVAEELDSPVGLEFEPSSESQMQPFVMEQPAGAEREAELEEAASEQVAASVPEPITAPTDKKRPPASPVRKNRLILAAAILGMLVLMFACVGGGLWVGTRLVGGVLIPRWEAVLGPDSTRVQQPSGPAVTVPPYPPASQTSIPNTQVDLQLYKAGDESLFVVNQGPGELMLAPLQLGNTPSKVFGNEWDVDRLLAGQCVAVWKDHGKSETPEALDCEQLGKHLERKGKDRFWSTTFNIYYGGDFVGTCKNKDEVCKVQIPAGR